ncbi:hypothetical protein BGZ76_003501 [Entomortierella beljakovae]|nr:hypothetical protein BGZ76_003501 [Entomortierella beljakovae]
MSRIQVNVFSAEEMKDVERMGKNDPYVTLTLDLKNKDSFVKTAIKKNAGKEATWNETLFLENYDPNRHNELFVNVLDDESLADEPIGFTAIGLNQVSNAPGKALKAKYELNMTNGKQKGFITIEVIVLHPGEQARALSQAQAARGNSQLNGAQQDYIKGLERKEKAGDAAAAAAIVGGLFAAKGMMGGKKEQKEA